MSVLDVKAVGRWYNVEMQISEDLNFDQRAIYYWAKLVTEQLGEGMMFRELRKTVSINILDFNFVPDPAAYHSLYKIINTASCKDDGLHDIFELHYIELRKFKKEYKELVNPLDRWITFLTKAGQLAGKKLPDTLAMDQSILKAIGAVGRMFDEDERIIYDVRMQAMLDVESKIVSAEEKGVEKGLAKGMEKGKTEGMADSLLIILTGKYGELPDWVHERVNGAGCEQLKQWMGKAMTNERLDELF